MKLLTPMAFTLHTRPHLWLLAFLTSEAQLGAGPSWAMPSACTHQHGSAATPTAERCLLCSCCRRATVRLALLASQHFPTTHLPWACSSCTSRQATALFLGHQARPKCHDHELYLPKACSNAAIHLPSDLPSTSQHQCVTQNRAHLPWACSSSTSR